MKKVLLLALICFAIEATGSKIVKTPGSTTDVFTEFALRSVMAADTLIIEGGTGDITLQAGPIDDGSPYHWDMGSEYLSTHSVNFTYLHATNTLTNGAKGLLIAISRGSPAQSQYLWVVYQNLPLKPSKPMGETVVCNGSNSSYTSASVNATSYEWQLTPAGAGNLQNETTSSVSVSWNSTWTGTASLSVKGVNAGNYSPLSELLTVEVNATPSKPSISGSSLADKGSTKIYLATAENATSWEWYINPQGIVNSTSSGNTTSIDFTETGTFNITANATNTCGTGPLSDAFTVTVVAISGLQAQVDQLVADTTSKGLSYRETIANLKVDNANQLLDIENLTSVNSNLSTKVDSLTLANEGLQGEVDVLSADNKVLEIEIVTLYTETDSLRNVVFEKDFIIDDQKVEIQEYLSTITDLEDQLYTLELSISSLEDEIVYLTSENQDLENELNEILLQIIRLEYEVDNLQTTNADLQSQITLLNAKVNALRTLVDDLMTTNQRLVGENNGLTTTNASLQHQVNTLQTTITELEQQIANLSQVYVLSWEVENVTTHVFETEIGNFSISLYPNPSPGEVFISCTELVEEIKIYNLQGQLLKQEVVNSYETSFTVNRSQMPIGTYLVHIKTAKGNSIHRIVFQ